MMRAILRRYKSEITEFSTKTSKNTYCFGQLGELQEAELKKY